MDSGEGMSLRTKENPACDTDKKETSVDTDVHEIDKKTRGEEMRRCDCFVSTERCEHMPRTWGW